MTRVTCAPRESAGMCCVCVGLHLRLSATRAAILCECECLSVRVFLHVPKGLYHSSTEASVAISSTPSIGPVLAQTEWSGIFFMRYSRYMIYIVIDNIK